MSELANTAAERWFKQYQYCMDSFLEDGRTPRAVHHALVALGPRPDVEDIDKVIGNTCWTRPCPYGILK